MQPADGNGNSVGVLAQVLLSSEKAEIHRGNAIAITTPPEQWAYAAQLPREGYLSSLGRGSVYVRLHVTEGEIGIGIVTADAQAFVVERRVGVSTLPQLVTLPITQSGAGDLVIRNAAAGGNRSKVVVYQLSVVPSYQGQSHLPDYA